jgi:hypothetical protein
MRLKLFFAGFEGVCMGLDCGKLKCYGHNTSENEKRQSIFVAIGQTCQGIQMS